MFFDLTVDTIVKDFTKIVDRLDKIVNNHANVVSVNEIAISALQVDNTNRLAEVERAKKIKENINNLLSI